MQKKSTHRLGRFCLTLALCCFYFSGFAQEYFSSNLKSTTKPTNVPLVNQSLVSRSLKETLTELQNLYGIQFSFNATIAQDLLRQVPAQLDGVKNVEDLLTQILAPNNLKFKKVNEVYIILKSEKEEPTSVKEFQKAESFLKAIQVEFTITGKVTDENGQGLPGVTVILKGTTTGTATNSDGGFSLTIPDGNGILVASFIGYQSKEIPVNNQTTITIQLTSDTKALEEVVVIGYGTQKKSDVTGAVSSVKAETLEERPSANLTQALAGRVTGANVSVNSGRPGGAANIRIRGNTSVSVTNNPLYVVDGVILNVTNLGNGTSPIDYMNPNDIASIEVLKDASATAIYGARGANGVILVTTKRGSQDGGRVNYDTYFSVGTMARRIDLLNSREFLHVEDGAYQNAQKYDPEGWAAGKYVDPRTKRTNPLLFDANGNPLYDTDWQKEASQKAFTQNHQLSFTGGSDKSSFGAYLGYRDEDGLMRESWLKRYSGRFVFDSQIKKWLKVGGSLSYNDQQEKQLDLQGEGGITFMRQVLEALPIIPIRYPDGTWAGNADYPGMEGGDNPLQVGAERRYILKTQNTLGNLYTSIQITKDLELRTVLGTNIINQAINYYGGRELNYISKDQGGVAYVQNQRHNSWQFENYLTYNKKISANHSLTGLLGLSWQHVDVFTARAQSQNFQDDYFGFNNLGAGATAVAPTSGTSAYGLNSYFGRVNYNIKEKYLVTLTGRADGSSKFGSENRYAFFPSAALAWRVSEENFLKGIPVLSELKLRTSYGVTGNSEINAYQAEAGMGNYEVIFNGVRTIGVGVSRLANPNLQWEKTHQVDAGLELGLLSNRIALEVDVYRKKTTNMLLSAPVPSSSGYTTVTRNVGSMENRGIEFGLNTVNISTGDFTWNTNFNISINKNKVLALTGGDDIFSGRGIIREGEPVGSFFGYVRQGTWSTAEADIAAKYLRLPGDVKYQDVNNDGQINDRDRVIIGKGIPDGFGSLINTFKYKNFDLTLDLQFMYGNDVNLASQHSAEDRQGIANSFATVLNAWTPENQNTDIAQWRPIPAGYDTFDDSHRVQDADFIRGRNLLFGYNFNAGVTEKLRISRLRVYASMQNFFLITKYEGYDPEVATSGGTFDQGLALYDYPKPRVFMVGLNLGF